jgi:mannan endo-1,4-beta-mannosidase
MRTISISTILIAIICVSAIFTSEAKGADKGFVTVRNGEFYIGNKPYRYVGTNFWYGTILASEGGGGNRARLKKELDLMKKTGIDNLRILVGGDGPEGIPSHIEPTLQTAPGVYNDTILEGLDYLLVQMEKRGMKAILYMDNAWEWSGGYATYLQWAGEGKAPIPSVDGWPTYMKYVQKFVNCEKAMQMSLNHVKFIASRVNSITGKPYSECPAIMAWQVANEPRAFSDANKKAFAEWVHRTAIAIKSVDKNHLVCTGSEGMHGCEDDMALFNEIHSFPEIDYANVHIWPYNWEWINKETVIKNVQPSCENTKDYIEKHYALMSKIGKPITLEEFGYPRDGFVFTPGSPTTGRDAYYKYVFSIIRDSGMIAGCNFWGWGGYAQPCHKYWERGDDYCGDPSQEEQGLNSVFATDKSTLDIIKQMAKEIKKANK